MNSTTNYDSMLYTVSEVAKIMHTNKQYVYNLISSNQLPAIKLGSLKVRHETLCNFFKANEGKDLTDPFNIKPISYVGGEC
jgi:excisionase family DNA binding protein